MWYKCVSVCVLVTVSIMGCSPHLVVLITVDNTRCLSTKIPCGGTRGCGKSGPCPRGAHGCEVRITCNSYTSNNNLDLRFVVGAAPMAKRSKAWVSLLGVRLLSRETLTSEACITCNSYTSNNNLDLRFVVGATPMAEGSNALV